ncbi:hypothetical protein [uncultured Campylobacter sp.]|uniref:hypothetical protein n=1 Tax=uncultured Campylobacter sp. TaxID=218934 RepID=UPI00261A46E3|nr:hypothetical protein [uncultured Campylobacter sp.]
MKKKKIIKKIETLKSENKKWQEKIEDMEKRISAVSAQADESSKKLAFLMRLTRVKDYA